ILASVRELADSLILDRLAQIPGASSLRLSPLDSSNAEELVRRLATNHELDAATIAREAGGHPMFIEELVRHVRDGAELQASLRLEDALTDRISGLSDSARGVIETLAVAGRPISRELGARALHMEVAPFVSEIEALQL